MSHEKKLLLYLACFVVLKYSIRNPDALRDLLTQATGTKPPVVALNHWLTEHIWKELRSMAGVGV